MQIEVSALPKTYAELHALTVSLIQSIEQQTTEFHDTIEHQRATLTTQAVTIEKLQYELARLKRWRFGASSERGDPDQLSLWQTALDEDIAAVETQLEAVTPAAIKPPRRSPKRFRPPAHLPRIEHRYELDADCCADCGQQLVRFGEAISEQLDIIPAQFLVHRHIRGQYACRACETVITAEMSAQAIEKGLPAPGLGAQVLVSKYAYHLPLYRQAQIYAAQGVHIPRSTQAGWVGYYGVLLEPLVAALRQVILREAYLQADETPVPVLAPGTGKTKTGYLWVYRTGPFSPIQAVVFDYGATRGQIWPTTFLQDFRGILQVDGYRGYHAVLARSGMIEAGCWAHARRQFYEVFQVTRSKTANTALQWIAQLYAIEAELQPLSAEARVQGRQARAGPVLQSFKAWLEETLPRLPPRSSLAQACAYTLNRWTALTVCLSVGDLHLDNNPVERAIRGVALGKKNYLFAGSDLGGQRAALMYTLIETCKLNGVDPFAYLKDVLTRLPSLPASRLPELFPWQWTPITDAP